MRGTLLGAVVTIGLLAVAAGCGGTSEAAKPSDKKEVASSGHGWWCDEHGVKEDECSMCNREVAKACKAKGDWCEKHDRAKSQCFICDPSLREKFAGEYRAKYGKEPPEPKDNMPEKK